MDWFLEWIFILLLFAIMCIPVGFLKPDLFHSWFRKKLSRIQTALAFTGITFLLFILGIGISYISHQVVNSGKQNSTAATNVKKVAQPTPTLSDPCAQYAGTDQIQECAQMQDAKAKGEALQHPLKAKVTFDSLYLYATNLESNEWDNCTATLDDTNPEADNFQSDVFTLKPGEEQTISWGNFANTEGQRFNYFQTKPKFVDLDCTVNNQEHRSLFNL